MCIHLYRKCIEPLKRPRAVTAAVGCEHCYYYVTRPDDVCLLSPLYRLHHVCNGGNCFQNSVILYIPKLVQGMTSQRLFKKQNKNIREKNKMYITCSSCRCLYIIYTYYNIIVLYFQKLNGLLARNIM